MRSPLVMPRAGQKSLRRLVSFTRRSPSATSTSSWSRGIIAPVGQRAGVGGGRRGPRRVAGWWSVVARGLALGAEDMTFQSPVHAEPLRGRAAFADLVRQAFAFARPLSFDFTHIAVAGDVVLAGGRRIEWWGMSVAEVQGGRIRRWREYWNPADVA